MFWILQGRDEDGVWRRVYGYKSERSAMNAIRRVNNSNPYRIVTVAFDGAVTIHAVRN